MAEPGTHAHFFANRSSYLTRDEARRRIRVGKTTLKTYLAEGLPSYDLLGTRYVLEGELLAMFRAKRKRNSAHTALDSVDLPDFERKQ